jgi:lipopolysaccharide heptosyltransferase I
VDNFLIIRLSSLGDIIHALPAFAVLRKGFPEARLAWVVEKAGREILDLVSGVDEIVVRGDIGWFRRLRLRDRTAIDFQGLIKSAILGRLSGARRRIGFSGKNLKEPAAAIFYTERLSAFEETGHVIGKNIRLLETLGLPPGTDGYEFPLVIPETSRCRVAVALERLGRTPERKVVLCNVGAAWKSKRWPAERWIELLPAVARKDLFPVLLWGNASEKETALTIANRTGVPAAPFFTIPEVFALIAASGLLISGDTFALQAACALDVPVVGLYGPTDPKRNGPFRERDRTAQTPMDCRPCWKRDCPTIVCMSAISASDVAGLVKEVLDRDV